VIAAAKFYGSSLPSAITGRIWWGKSGRDLSQARDEDGMAYLHLLAFITEREKTMGFLVMRYKLYVHLYPK
jgi:hypothetical protein